MLGSALFGATLSGEIRDETTNLTVPNVSVHIWYLDWEIGSGIPRHHVSFTDSSGLYEFLDLAEGLYTLSAWHFLNYENFSLDEITITGDLTLDISLSPLPGMGSITGQVTDEISGEALASHFLKFIPLSENQFWHSTWTDSMGYYSVNLTAGNYYAMCFQSIQDSTTDHDNRFHHDSSSWHFNYFELYDNVQAFHLATPIAVQEGETISGINFTLPTNSQGAETAHFTNILNGFLDEYISYHEETGLGYIQYIIIDQLDGGDIGDEIGILDYQGIPDLNDCGNTNQDNVLVGAGVWIDESLIIPIYGSVEDCDGNGIQYPGFIDGNQIEVRFWDASEQTETTIYVNFDYGSPTPDAGGMYAPSLFGNDFIFLTIQTSLGLSQGQMLPNDIVIEKNYPNPFNPKTSIQFSLETQQTISIKILDLNGHLVKSLIRDILPAGKHKVQWDGLDKNNLPVSSGVYIFSLQSEGKRFSQKMILLK
jgi:hypothetical protein